MTYRGIYYSRPMPSMFENSYSLKFGFDLLLYYNIQLPVKLPIQYLKTEFENILEYESGRFD
jgi:hypothetical protein